MSDRTVLRGDADELQALLARWWHDGDLLERPTRAQRLPDGRWQLVVRLSPRLVQPADATRGRNAATVGGVPAANPGHGSAANPGLRKLDRRLAVVVAVIAVTGASCYLAGVTGWGLGVLRNLGIAALLLTTAVALIAVAINEVRDTRRR